MDDLVTLRKFSSLVASFSSILALSEIRTYDSRKLITSTNDNCFAGNSVHSKFQSARELSLG